MKASMLQYFPSDNVKYIHVQNDARQNSPNDNHAAQRSNLEDHLDVRY